jgi:hypothetical protein
MKLSTIGLALAFALSGTFAFAQSSNGTAGGPTTLSGTGTSATGSASGNQPCDNPNGCPNGPTSLSGTGSSQFGGSTSNGPGKN